MNIIWARYSWLIWGVCLSSFTLGVCADDHGEKKTQMWFAAGQEGIYKGVLSHKTGKFEAVGVAKSGVSSDYIVQHPKLPLLYSINPRGRHSSIVAYSIEKNGDLTEFSALGKRPEMGAHINISPDGKMLAVAYYNAGVTGVYALKDDGAIGDIILESKHTGSSVDKHRQASAHPHWVGFSRNGKYLYVTDLGTDHIWVYGINKRKKVRLAHKIATNTGAGPRHIAFHPQNAFLYVADELHSTVSVYTMNNKTGKLIAIETVEAAPENKKELWANVSDLRVHPSGKFLYVVNRGSDLISVFSVDADTGKLTPVEREPVRGSISRNVVITEDGKWAIAAAVKTSSVAVFKIVPETGELNFMAYKSINVPNARAIVMDGYVN